MMFSDFMVVVVPLSRWNSRATWASQPTLKELLMTCKGTSSWPSSSWAWTKVRMERDRKELFNELNMSEVWNDTYLTTHMRILPHGEVPSVHLHHWPLLNMHQDLVQRLVSVALWHNHRVATYIHKTSWLPMGKPHHAVFTENTLLTRTIFRVSISEGP